MKYNYILSLPTCGNKVFLATLDFWRIFKTQSHTTVKVNLQKRPRERKNKFFTLFSTETKDTRKPLVRPPNLDYLPY